MSRPRRSVVTRWSVRQGCVWCPLWPPVTPLAGQELRPPDPGYPVSVVLPYALVW